MRKTNPILRLRIADFGLRIGHRPAPGRRIVQNEPNFTTRPGLRRAKCAKRTQFRPGRDLPLGKHRRKSGSRRPTLDQVEGGLYEEPTCAKRSQFLDCGLGADLRRGDGSCKTNPIPPVGRGPGGRNVRNEANFQRARHPTIPSFQSSSPMPFVQNKANFRRGRVGRAVKVRNKAKLGQPGISGEQCWGAIAQNKANLRGRAGWDGVRGTGDGGRAVLPWAGCAKQSQFRVRPARRVPYLSLRAERGNPPPYAGRTPLKTRDPVAVTCRLGCCKGKLAILSLPSRWTTATCSGSGSSTARRRRLSGSEPSCYLFRGFARPVRTSRTGSIHLSLLTSYRTKSLSNCQ